MTGAPSDNVRPRGRPRGRPRAILFDWDNTLVDSWPAIHDSLNFTFEAFGHQTWTLEQTHRRVRKSLRDSFPALFGECWEEAGEVFYRRFGAIHLERLQPFAGAGRMLEELKSSGIYLGVVSNKKGEYLRRETDHLGWDGLFGKVVGAMDAERDKPSADPVDLALDGSGIGRGAHVWIAGDADIDMQCAFNAGCMPVLVRAEPPGDGEFGDYPPSRHFKECLALSSHVREL